MHLVQRAIAAAVLAAATAAPGAAQTLDVSVDGDDLVFTWDGGADDLLRGTEPDDLQPWMTSVTSPLRVAGENALRGENAWYRLASGSNIGFRVEVFVPRLYETVPGLTCLMPLTLADRRQAVTARDLFSLWPTLVEVQWWDAAAGIHRGVTRYGADILGPDTPLPAHGGILAAFSADTTVTIVGSGDPDAPGVSREELSDGFLFGGGLGVLPVPPHARWERGFELLCGEEGTDWTDDDLDGRPDACGRDTDGDDRPDTGLYAGGDQVHVEGSADGRPCTTVHHVTAAPDPFSNQHVIAGLDFPLVPGHAALVGASPDTPFNTPFRPPTW